MSKSPLVATTPLTDDDRFPTSRRRHARVTRRRAEATTSARPARCAVCAREENTIAVGAGSERVRVCQRGGCRLRYEASRAEYLDAVLAVLLEDDDDAGDAFAP